MMIGAGDVRGFVVLARYAGGGTIERTLPFVPRGRIMMVRTSWSPTPLAGMQTRVCRDNTRSNV